MTQPTQDPKSVDEMQKAREFKKLKDLGIIDTCP